MSSAKSRKSVVTRINVVPPSELVRQHLIAEYRELPRIFTLVMNAQRRKLTPFLLGPRTPHEYTLGRGHVIFFYGRLTWLRRRHGELVAEMIVRGYDPKFTDLSDKLTGLDPHWFNDWEPDERALAINRARIKERLPSTS